MPTREDHIILIGIFAGTGWRLRFADSLESAYEILCERALGVVLCSQDLSGIDWRDAVEILGSAPSRPRVILVCRAIGCDETEPEKPPGLYRVISKPLFGKEVIDAVEYAITSRDGYSAPA